ncbi:kinase [Microdochium trichocladiopsis]|uniref:EKC/KEOPS complex subunit BUD32 n=1 Tax=Microdochium trichocladiopsis TaxID=1682393 RepID=A0A9P8XSP8_9PEZI|nr:kinase [Microdochium trichocladiopsis]KAH7012583.1 kinase [Microdochium trichocladiopsis]
MWTLVGLGSTGGVYELDSNSNTVLKLPWQIDGDEAWNAKLLKHFEIEHKVYRLLGENEHILPYFGPEILEKRQGLVLAKADRSLQEVLDKTWNATSDFHKRWCVEAAKAVAYIHERGVYHCDLRPDNFLVLNNVLQLGDFGGAVCLELGLDAKKLPDDGFFNLKPEVTAHTDIFALGSILYSILTGHWPFCGTGEHVLRTDVAHDEEYGKIVKDNFGSGKYPEVATLEAGGIILGCWTGQYDSAQDIVVALERAFNESAG